MSEDSDSGRIRGLCNKTKTKDKKIIIAILFAFILINFIFSYKILQTSTDINLAIEKTYSMRAEVNQILIEKDLIERKENNIQYVKDMWKSSLNYHYGDRERLDFFSNIVLKNIRVMNGGFIIVSNEGEIIKNTFKPLQDRENIDLGLIITSRKEYKLTNIDEEEIAYEDIMNFNKYTLGNHNRYFIVSDILPEEEKSFYAEEDVHYHILLITQEGDLVEIYRDFLLESYMELINIVGGLSEIGVIYPLVMSVISLMSIGFFMFFIFNKKNGCDRR